MSFLYEEEQKDEQNSEEWPWYTLLSADYNYCSPLWTSEMT